MNSKNLLAVVNRIQNLPTLPEVVEKVLALVDDPETSTANLAKIISNDQALMSKVLKVVNSAYYGLPRKISTLTQATVILGFNTIKNLVLTASVFSTFGSDGVQKRFSRADFWAHSLGCATGCKILSKRIRFGLPEEAFVAGLIHDMGKVVIDQFLPQDFGAILDLVDSEKIRIIDAEKKVLGVDHTQIGQWLAEKWNLPPHLVAAIAYHHAPQFAGENKKIVAIVHLSDAIARLEHLGYGGDHQAPIIDSKSWEMLSIPEDELGEIICEIREEFDKSKVFLALDK
ncbi:HD family phosphohydrolase [candidate division KSB1 bacterium]|nr:HDOD domain-containing protein [bacterium]OQX57965.1 MAG: hypothetical protein B5M50_05115 [candidate division KSB1 bacterium 4484_219]RKY76820.1 MAG: HD family phosphohydrolase [candidate division KSB1 bacterium]RKY77279.1 MAG: HD family phosphohydrolase [candidate division KSB1 bacterium]RKY81823.1 MAG: HD family phosphohydrolase [candidate division KSB1 bacterium]